MGAGSKISVASQLAMTSSPAISRLPWLWRLSLFGGLIECGAYRTAIIPARPYV
jgi:hypothetical protein